MEMKDYLEIKALSGEGLSPYEQFKTQHMQAKSHTSGIGVAGLVTGVVGTVAGLTAWIFGGMQAAAKGKEAKEAAYSAKELAIAKNDGLRELVTVMAQNLAAERAERINGQTTISQTITDTISGQQQGSQSQSQTVTQDVVQQVMAGLMTGKYTENAQKVELMSPAQPFRCGCNQCGD